MGVAGRRIRADRGVAGTLGVVGVAVALTLPGCGDDTDEPDDSTQVSGSTTSQTTTDAGPALKPARCPPGLAGCLTASGRIIGVEKVDPDGDGDAHFVLESSEAITGPGISVVDVSATLRPDPLPAVGDELSAAGTVARGSYGQRQIEAVAIRFARRG